jgi:hypothetical protein
MYNNTQMMGLTGKRFKPSWDAYYSEQAQSLPNMMALGARKEYQDEMGQVEQDRLDMENKYYDKQQSNAKTGNWISGASLGLQGLNTANQLFGGNLLGAAASGIGHLMSGVGDVWDAASDGFLSLWA